MDEWIENGNFSGWFSCSLILSNICILLFGKNGCSILCKTSAITAHSKWHQRSKEPTQAREMKREREIAKITGSTRSFSSASLKYLLFVFLSFYLHPDTRKKNCVNQFGYAKSTCVCMATRENSNSAFLYVRVSNPKHSQWKEKNSFSSTQNQRNEFQWKMFVVCD